MNWKKNNKYIKWGLTAFVVICASIVFYYILFHAEIFKGNLAMIGKILSPILYGMAIAYLLTPILNFIQYQMLSPLCDKLKWKKSDRREHMLRIFSVLLTLAFVLGAIVALVSLIISEIVPSIVNISNNFDIYMDNVSAWLTKLFNGNPSIRDFIIRTIEKYSMELDDILNSALIEKGGLVLKTVSLSVISVFKFLWNFILGFIISVYLLSGKEKFTGEAKRCIFAFFSENTANRILNNFKFSHKTFSGFVSGKVIDSIIIGIICMIGTSILGTPYAALVSLLIGITNIIPFFGPFLGAIPSCLLIFLVDPMHPLNLVYFLIFILILQQIDGNFIGPKILGSSTGLTGFWVIFAITVFGGLFGIIGILAGVPLFAVIYAFVRSYIEMRLAKKNLDLNSVAYTNVNGIVNGVYSLFIPEYTMTKKMLKQQNNKKNLIKNYGEKFICEFDASAYSPDGQPAGTDTDTSLEEEDVALPEEELQEPVTEDIIAENENDSQ